MDITKSVFVEGSPKKSIWFKNVIEEFYIKLYGRNINAPQLREINKEVIAYMVDNLRNMKGAFSQSPRQEPQTLYSRSNESTRNPDEYNEKFNNRQKEYETMIKKPQPPEIKFTDVVKDEPISNMEELLKKQQQMRDYELSQPRFEVIQPQNNPDKIKINNQENITIEVDNELTENKQKKVSWSDEFDIKAEFQEIKTQLRQLFKLIEGLQQIKPTEPMINSPKIISDVNSI
jgi:hypothetical protein